MMDNDNNKPPSDLGSSNFPKLDEPRINSSRYEAYSIQNAIHRLANIRSEVEEEVLAAVSAPSTSSTKKGFRPSDSIGHGSKGGRHSSASASSALKTGAGSLVESERIFGLATKKLNVPVSSKLYHGLTELNAPPTQVKIKRPPKCEKKVDPAPCLQDYIQPKYCCIKPVRDYSCIDNYCNRDPLPEIDCDEDYDYLFISPQLPFTTG